MARNSIWATFVAVLLSFAAGFIFANYLNRSELSSMKTGNDTPQAANGLGNSPQTEATLSNEEIEAKLVEAEQNADNFTFQRNLGLGLYRYGAMKKDAGLIEKAIPVLVRANGLNPDDYDIIVALGHANYDVAYFSKNHSKFDDARKYYDIALNKRPDDIEVRTDLGLTYFLQEPPNYATALTHFEKSLTSDPRHEKTLAFAALSMKNQNLDPSKFVSVLRTVNPDNVTLREIESGSVGPSPR